MLRGTRLRGARLAGAALLAVGLTVGAVTTVHAATGSDTRADAASERAGRPGETGVRFATYNVRTSHLNNKWAGDPDKVYDRDDAKRMARVARFIKDRNLDIISVQEVRHKERRGIMKNLPKNFRASKVKGRSDTAIIWNTSKWKHLRHGWFDTRIRATRTRPQIWMKLQNRRTGRKVIVSSVHFAARDHREHLRIDAAKRTVKALRRVANGVPFIVAGDINGNDMTPGRMGAFKVFKNAGLTYTRYTAKYRRGNNCDSHNGRAGFGKQECWAKRRGSHIDMVWTSKGFRTGSYNLVATAKTSRTSDHNPLITQLWLRSQTKAGLVGVGSTAIGFVATPR